MNRGQPQLRLRLARIEKKPKSVHIQRFQDFAGIVRRPDLKDELDDIIESISRGDGVPEKYYRAGIDDSEDRLLEDKGIMHLHLGGKHSDVIVFLIQYADQVVLLETNSHIHLNQQPAGRNLLALTQTWLADLETMASQAAEAAKAAATEAERRKKYAAKAKIADAIAAFKAKANLK
jgi:hypothetical protein